MTATITEPFVAKADVARHLGCSPWQVDVLVRRGMPSHRIGRLRRYRITEVSAWVLDGGAS